MKKFTKLFETYGNPGNALAKTGVSNHYTPVDNILTNIRNLFCVQLSIVAERGEDNVSIKLTSSRFTSEQAMQQLLYTNLYNDVSNTANIYSYITSQGLTKFTAVNLGVFWIAYFSPEDIKTAEDPKSMAANAKSCKDKCCGDCGCDCCSDTCPCPCEALESVYDEFELGNMITEDDAEEEMKDITLEKIMELIDSKDKVKAAKQLEILVAQQINLPREYYFAGIKFKNNDEAIALRWKYTKKLPTGNTSENTRSIMHIFGKGDKAIWVQDFDKDSIVKLPADVKKLIESVLELLEAEKTSDPAVYKLTGEKKEREDKKDDKDDKDKDENKDKENKDNKDNESDDEDDKSRGDDSDDLLG